MVSKDPHISDQDLLLAADAELSARRQQKVRRHLQTCRTCRKRMAELENNIAQFVDCYHSLLDPQLPPAAGSEALLNQRLQADTQGWTPSRFFLACRGPALLAVASLVVVVSVYLWQQQIRNAPAQTIPDPSLTPGEATPVSKSDVCQAQPQVESRQVPEALRDAVFNEYGMKDVPRSAYEVDFLITPELGGSASIRNLWPEPYFSRAWNAHAKDALEERLHTLVCTGELDLSTAQREIATNWVDAYKKYVGTEHPM